MDEIRGLWRGRGTNNWHYGDLIRAKSENNHSPIIIEGGVRYSVFPDTLGECTGLRDKNGRLIFEGDIMSFMESTEKYYVTKWDSENACFYYERDVYVKALCASQYGIIVGNIHDNPELI